ncbi:AMMECR1 domain-containing protein [Malaciobacter molluscorum LMG 25693]|uniref:AMMECR1 domain-containing protein n=1 Tax=Malaciobacter molluscorum LMG 25693 TaxID=870501 RepID=A0A2G1DJD2_9BACT|nr:AmmeMemoRadiSam system protein A [Malaciobacter molluscorum]AXX91588.1 AmmeMemoRadiSam system protein A [Malaciobacter molluscorum LMG 25693]PHO18615.1 AMMECR1 domain-containing protein [Malaciobacter molluscorum LMG 25693]
MDLKILLDVARKSIFTYFDKSLVLNKDYYLSNYDELSENRASFVALKLNGRLRGSFGSFNASKQLFEDVFDNARKAAFNDPSFEPIEIKDFTNIKIEVSVLTPSKKIDYIDKYDLKEKIIPKKHGVILEYQDKKATFLPQVWDELQTFEQFITSLCLKAGVSSSCFENNAKVFIYEVIKEKEE